MRARWVVNGERFKQANQPRMHQALVGLHLASRHLRKVAELTLRQGAGGEELQRCTVWHSVFPLGLTDPSALIDAAPAAGRNRCLDLPAVYAVADRDRDGPALGLHCPLCQSSVVSEMLYTSTPSTTRVFPSGEVMQGLAH